jgi:hypothetical protein
MKKDKIIFWSTTGIITLMMLFSAFSYLTNYLRITFLVKESIPLNTVMK